MNLGSAIALWLLTCFLLALANTAGYHRLLAHRSYATPTPIRHALTLLSALHSGSPVLWVGLHRVHHAFSDTTIDPHSPSKGFWYAHSGWLVFGTRYPLLCILFALSGVGLQLVYLTHDVRRLVGQLKPEWRRMSRDLMREPLMVWLDTPFVIPALFALQISAAWAIGRAWGLLWLWALHVVQNNASWIINSACHDATGGPKPGGSADRSRNVAWLAWFTNGDSFHGHHHRHPSSARHALEGGADVSWLFICLMHRLGWATRVRQPAGFLMPTWAQPMRRKAKNRACG